MHSTPVCTDRKVGGGSDFDRANGLVSGLVATQTTLHSVPFSCLLSNLTEGSLLSGTHREPFCELDPTIA